MEKYQIMHEIWRVDGIHDFTVYQPTKGNFISYATENENGCEHSTKIADFDSREAAIAAIKKYRCTYEPRENYNDAIYELYCVEKITYSDDGDAENYEIIQYAEIIL